MANEIIFVLSPRITLNKVISNNKIFIMPKSKIDTMSKLGVQGPVLKNVTQNKTTALLIR